MKKLLIALLSLILILSMLTSCDEALLESIRSSLLEKESSSTDTTEPVENDEISARLIVNDTVVRPLKSVAVRDGKAELPLVDVLKALEFEVSWYTENIARIDSDEKSWILDINAKTLVALGSESNTLDNILIPAPGEDNFQCRTVERNLIISETSFGYILKELGVEDGVILTDLVNATVDVKATVKAPKNYLTTVYEGYLSYTLSEDETYYVVNGVKSYFNSSTILNVIIPEYFNDLPVREVKALDYINYRYYYGDEVGESSPYYSKSKIKSITIPSTVTSISDSVLQNEYLEDIIVSEDNTSYKLLDDVLYSGDGKALVMCLKKRTENSISIPEGVEEIREGAFKNVKNLMHVELPSTLKKIDSDAFLNCSSLMSINLPSSLTEIKGEAFKGCHRLVEIYNHSSLDIQAGSDSHGGVAKNAIIINTAIDTPSDITNINDEYIFLQNEEKSVLIRYIGNERIIALPSDIGEYEIAPYAFYDESGIIQLTLPKSVTKIGENAFDGCINLYRINISDVSDYLKTDIPSINSSPFINEAELYVSGECITELTVSESVPSNAFYACSSIKSVVIGDGATKIGDRAFGECSSLESVTISDTVTELGAHAFYLCNSLKDVSLGASLSTIPEYTFWGCKSLKEIVIPRGIKRIENNAFEGCFSLKYVEVFETLEYIEAYAFNNCPELRVIHLPVGMEISSTAFENTEIIYVYYYG